MAGFKLFNFTQQLLAFSMRVRAARHEMLAANVANADTPGYRPRDIDFDSVMKAAAEIEPHPALREMQMGLVSAIPLESHAMGAGPAALQSGHGEERLDGNSVSLDRQITMMTENALAYETSMTLLSRTMASLRYAISEGRR
jgi:flagellar basal-body rod protein FlgB